MSTVSTAPGILLVEDETLTRVAVALELANAGWSVVEASTGEAALQLFRGERPVDLLVTDIQLGGHLNGWELAADLRAFRPDIPVVYMSGRTVERSLMVPGSVFLCKPCSPADVLAACREAMQYSRHTA